MPPIGLRTCHDGIADRRQGGLSQEAGMSEPPMPYETEAPNAYRWTNDAFSLLICGDLIASVKDAGDVQTAIVQGKCPRCGHTFSFRQVQDAVSGEAMTALGQRRAERESANYVELTVSCLCEEEHPGRPPGGDHGCGINFRVDVLPSAS